MLQAGAETRPRERDEEERDDDRRPGEHLQQRRCRRPGRRSRGGRVRRRPSAAPIQMSWTNRQNPGSSGAGVGRAEARDVQEHEDRQRDEERRRPEEGLQQTRDDTDDERVEGPDADEGEDRPEGPGVRAEAEPADQVDDGRQQDGDRRDQRVPAAGPQVGRDGGEHGRGDVAARSCRTIMNRKIPRPMTSPAGERADVAHDHLRRPGSAVTARTKSSVAFATRRPPALATITVAGRRGSAVGTMAASRSRWRTSCVAPASVDAPLMAKAEPPARSRPARSGAVCAGGPTTADLDPVRMGLVVDADDAEREQGREEDGEQEGPRRTSGLRALRLLGGAIGLSVVAHRGPLLIGWRSSSAGGPRGRRGMASRSVTGRRPALCRASARAPAAR